MGCGTSNLYVVPQATDADEVSSDGKWKCRPSLDEAKEKYINDGTLPEDFKSIHLELRALLDDSVAVYAIRVFSKTLSAAVLLDAWLEIRAALKMMSEDCLKACKAINSKYIDTLPSCFVKFNLCIDESSKKIIASSLEQAKAAKANSNERLECLELILDHMRPFHIKIFVSVCDNVFEPFRLCQQYADLHLILKDQYNQVLPDDFEYISKLGNGAFGIVVKCKKKSTGAMHAIKIQRKKALLEASYGEPWRIDDEKKAYATCQHPFIVEFAYSFQTETLVMIVMSLCGRGDLRGLLLDQPKSRFPNEVVHFYAAEIVSALSYLHSLGLIYRDLKPGNILLNDDNHIKLVDLGTVVDIAGETLAKYNEAEEMAPVFDKISRQHTQNSASVNEDNDVSHISMTQAGIHVYGLNSAAYSNANSYSNVSSCHSINHTAAISSSRAKSIVGTVGYMAPEVVILLRQVPGRRKGYGYAVDWWSLGATIYKMYTGLRPYTAASKFYGCYFEDEDRKEKQPVEKPKYAMLDTSKLVDSPVGDKKNGDSPVGVKESMDPNVSNKKEEDCPSVKCPGDELIFDPSLFPKEGEDLLRRLLDFNPKTRLGSGLGSSTEVMTHPYFSQIEWGLLEQKGYVPPELPGVASADPQEIEKKKSREALNLSSIMYKSGCGSWLEDDVDDRFTSYFIEWDYVSPGKIMEEIAVRKK